jgi:diaminopimelate epimerase
VRSSTWCALGNTYVVAEPDDDRLDAALARELSAGVDGVLEILEATVDRVEIAIWNPDGSRAELSGNGTRIAAAWLAARSDAREIAVVVGDRVVRSKIRADGVVEQDVGPVEVGPAETIDGIEFIPVSVGNPHAVVIGEPADVQRIGPLLESNPRFPERTNVQVARIDGPGDVTARVWERGVGETASSGTSAVAVAAATHADGEVVVRFPGGELRVLLEGGRATLFGTAERVA